MAQTAYLSACEMLHEARADRAKKALDSTVRHSDIYSDSELYMAQSLELEYVKQRNAAVARLKRLGGVVPTFKPTQGTPQWTEKL
jgi:hypothetical protein